MGKEGKKGVRRVCVCGGVEGARAREGGGVGRGDETRSRRSRLPLCRPPRPQIPSPSPLFPLRSKRPHSQVLSPNSQAGWPWIGKARGLRRAHRTPRGQRRAPSHATCAAHRASAPRIRVSTGVRAPEQGVGGRWGTQGSGVWPNRAAGRAADLTRAASAVEIGATRALGHASHPSPAVPSSQREAASGLRGEEADGNQGGRGVRGPAVRPPRRARAGQPAGPPHACIVCGQPGESRANIPWWAVVERDGQPAKKGGVLCFFGEKERIPLTPVSFASSPAALACRARRGTLAHPLTPFNVGRPAPPSRPHGRDPPALRTKVRRLRGVVLCGGLRGGRPGVHGEWCCVCV